MGQYDHQTQTLAKHSRISLFFLDNGIEFLIYYCHNIFGYDF